MSEPTMRDMAVAAKWLESTFGASRIQAVEVESLSWLIANVRAEQARATLAGAMNEARVAYEEVIEAAKAMRAEAHGPSRAIRDFDALVTDLDSPAPVTSNASPEGDIVCPGCEEGGNAVLYGYDADEKNARCLECIQHEWTGMKRATGSVSPQLMGAICEVLKRWHAGGLASGSSGALVQALEDLRAARDAERICSKRNRAQFTSPAPKEKP